MIEVTAIIVSVLALGLLTYALIDSREVRRENEGVYKDVIRRQAERITELENRLNSHNWQEFAALQNQVQSPTERAENVFALRQQEQEQRLAESYGLEEEELRHMEDIAQGADLTEPTIG